MRMVVSRRDCYFCIYKLILPSWLIPSSLLLYRDHSCYHVDSILLNGFGALLNYSLFVYYSPLSHVYVNDAIFLMCIIVFILFMNVRHIIINNLCYVDGRRLECLFK